MPEPSPARTRPAATSGTASEPVSGSVPVAEAAGETEPWLGAGSAVEPGVEPPGPPPGGVPGGVAGPLPGSIRVVGGWSVVGGALVGGVSSHGPEHPSRDAASACALHGVVIAGDAARGTARLRWRGASPSVPSRR